MEFLSGATGSINCIMFCVIAPKKLLFVLGCQLLQVGEVFHPNVIELQQSQFDKLLIASCCTVR